MGLFGVASGIYWLRAAARVFHASEIAASVYLVLGCVILAGLSSCRAL